MLTNTDSDAEEYDFVSALSSLHVDDRFPPPLNPFLLFFSAHGMPLKPNMNPNAHFKRISKVRHWGSHQRDRERDTMYQAACALFSAPQTVFDLVLDSTGRDVSSLSKKQQKAFLRGKRINIWKFVMRFSFGAAMGMDIDIYAEINAQNFFKKAFAKGCALKLLMVEVF
ncbi:hypothetical protein BC830DRAFT_1134284 [Chytriomyces sp. MP71]|nr:hypothetical protein BC830DRAFT_1134284 [Chytriomyces sp. MP71]